MNIIRTMTAAVSTLAFLSVSAGAVTENWVLSGQSNAVNLLGGKNIESVCIPMMASEGISVNFTGSGVGGQTIRGWNEGTASWGALQENLQSTGAPTDVFIWYQGEANGRDDLMNSDTYLDSLRSLVRRVRIAGSNPDMTVVICQLGNVTIDLDGPYHLAYPPIRDAQQRFVALDSNAILMPDIGRSLGDVVHLSLSSRNDLATEIGQALLKFRHGKENNWPGPVLDAAVVDGTDGVIAHFAEVQKLSGIQAADFALADPDSLNPCIAVFDSGNTLVSLRFQRAVKLPAKLIYGTGNNPQAALRDEAGYRAPAVQINLSAGVLKERLSFAMNGSFNRYPALNDTLPVTTLDAFVRDSVIEPFLSTQISVFAARSTGRIDTVTTSCSYMSLDPSIVTVNRYVVKGCSTGIARIRVLMQTTLGSKYDTVTVRVAPSTAILDSIRLSLDSLELMPMDSFRVHTTAYYHKNSTVFSWAVDTEAVWTSSDTLIASVIKGMIQSRTTVGMANIVASLNGKSDTCRLTVYTADTTETIFTNQVPLAFATGFYELGTLFKTTVKGRIIKARIYAEADEYGDHVVRIWRMADQALVAGPFHWNIQAGSAGWKTFSLPNPVAIAAGDYYTVSVSTANKFSYTLQGFAAPINNASLVTVIGSGTVSLVPGGIPLAVYSNQNYFRDVVFVPSGITGAAMNDAKNILENMSVSPNPFNPSVTLTFTSPRNGTECSSLMIYNTRGQKVADLTGQALKNGTLVWNAEQYPSGVYVVKYLDGSRKMTKRLVLQR
ncbi:MAG: DUF4082 domain-containing protein [Fibrobacterota bacterium]